MKILLKFQEHLFMEHLQWFLLSWVRENFWAFGLVYEYKKGFYFFKNPFKAELNILDGIFEKAPFYLFDWVLNAPLVFTQDFKDL